MNKNTLTAILMGFIICLGIAVIAISIKLSVRPNVSSDSKGTGGQPVSGVVEAAPTDTPTPEVTDVPEEPQVTTVTVQMVRTTETVNVRDDASTSGNKLGSAEKGSEFVMLEALDNGWTRIEYKDGTAYIKSDYLEQFEKEVEVTVTPTPEVGTDPADGTGDGTADPAGDNTVEPVQ